MNTDNTKKFNMRDFPEEIKTQDKNQKFIDQ